MAETGAWSTLTTPTNLLVAGNNVHRFTAGEAITEGMVVGFAATGVSNTVVPMDQTSGEMAIGVALYTAASGAQVAVACVGCFVQCVEGAGGTIDAGDLVVQDDNTAKGMVLAAPVTGSGATCTLYYAVGIATTDFSANGWGTIMVFPQVYTRINAS